MYSNKLTFKFGSDAPLNGIKMANYDLFNRKREKNASAEQQKTLTITANKNRSILFGIFNLNAIQGEWKKAANHEFVDVENK